MNTTQFRNIAAFVITGLKYVSYAGVIVCAVGLFHAIQLAYPLWLNSVKTEGVISGYKTVSWQSRRVFGGALTSTASANLPVITFRDQRGESVSFADNFGHDRLMKTGERVAVIYEANNPSNAIADKGYANWMAIFIWLFGVTVSTLGVLPFRKMDCRDLSA